MHLSQQAVLKSALYVSGSYGAAIVGVGISREKMINALQESVSNLNACLYNYKDRELN